MSIEGIPIPNYSHKQEYFNAFSHFLGVVIAAIVLFFAISKYIANDISVFYLVGLCIFSFTTCALYLVSGVYHFLDKERWAKKFFRVIDHCTIYILIAGTYTPICFVILTTHMVGLVMLIVEWVCAIIGIILNAFFFDRKAAKTIAFILYVAMGWLALYSGGFLYINSLSFLFILLGGITYTIGSILYALGNKNTDFHCVFHVFVLASTVLQTIGIFYLF